MGEWRSLGNPCVGGSELDMATTFFSQATAVVPLPGQPGRFLFMADQWDVRDLGRSRCAPGPWREGTRWWPLCKALPHLV